MKVYRDLFVYKSGVYSYSGVTGVEENATHSVRILGWGEQAALLPGSPPIKYWVSHILARTDIDRMSVYT